MARDLSPEELSDYIHNRPQGRMLDLSHLLSNRATLRGAGWALVQSSAKLDSMSLATDLAIKVLEMPDAPEDVKELARRILRGEGKESTQGAPLVGLSIRGNKPRCYTCLCELVDGVCPACVSALPQASEETG